MLKFLMDLDDQKLILENAYIGKGIISVRM